MAMLKSSRNFLHMLGAFAWHDDGLNSCRSRQNNSGEVSNKSNYYMISRCTLSNFIKVASFCPISLIVKVDVRLP